MQFDALFMALLIDPPSVKAATAMPVPTIARISAYSAADAPLVSASRFLIVVMSISFPVPGPARSGTAGRRNGAPRQDQQAVALGVRLMQFDALFMALLIEPPSVKAATAMPVPTIARINAYSAAEAPLVSVRRFLIVVIVFPHSPLPGESLRPIVQPEDVRSDLRWSFASRGGASKSSATLDTPRLHSKREPK